MPLLFRIHRDHTVGRFRAAARARYNEAIRLSTQDDRLAAVYLAGYAAEMCLKAAYFRMAGFSDSQLITFQDLQNARQHAVTTLGIGWRGRNLHDLESWGNLLVRERRRQGAAHRSGFLRAFPARVKRLQMNWAPELRYEVNRPHQAEVRTVLEASAWLLRQYRKL